MMGKSIYEVMTQNMQVNAAIGTPAEFDSDSTNELNMTSMRALCFERNSGIAGS